MNAIDRDFGAGGRVGELAPGPGTWSCIHLRVAALWIQRGVALGGAIGEIGRLLVGLVHGPGGPARPSNFPRGGSAPPVRNTRKAA
jgi:hypothetical protein